MTNFEDVGRFHNKFGLRSNLVEGAKPARELDQWMLDFRIGFMKEELDEFTRAADNADEAEMFDALLDLVYVALGTAHLLGYPWEMGWDLVQKANMAKVRAQSASESKRGSALDVIKPEGWEPPDIKLLLEALGWGPRCTWCGNVVRCKGREHELNYHHNMCCLDRR